MYDLSISRLSGRTSMRWLLTFTATVVSTYALDAVAAVGGLVLVWSGLLDDADYRLLIAFLAGSYVLWGAGLRVNLRANWALLDATGTSTNALSKAAHDLVARRTMRLRPRKIAAAIGYVSTEIAKEVPYYVGALGAALASESISSNDAIIFLGGANLGAAAYEYGLGRITQTFLRVRFSHASFDTDWVPKEYLDDYYSSLEPDEVETIAFFVDAIKHAEPDTPILFFGVGPTLHHVFLAAEKASEIHLGDYLPENLGEIERWIEHDDDAHDWRPFVRYTLQCEGIVSPTSDEISEREELTRAKITKLLEVDLEGPSPCVNATRR